MDAPDLQAENVLRPETLARLRTAPLTSSACSILERWAINTPELLRQLEKSGPSLLLSRLLEQERVEKTALESPKGRLLLSQGLSRWEVLTEMNVNPNLAPGNFPRP